MSITPHPSYLEFERKGSTGSSSTLFKASLVVAGVGVLGTVVGYIMFEQENSQIDTEAKTYSDLDEAEKHEESAASWATITGVFTGLTLIGGGTALATYYLGGDKYTGRRWRLEIGSSRSDEIKLGLRVPIE